jgi:FtsH-binding integral membrane protein
MVYGYERKHRYLYIRDIRLEAYRHLSQSLILASVLVAFLIQMGIEKILGLLFLGLVGELGIFFYLYLARITHKPHNEATATFLLYLFVVCSSVTLSLFVWAALQISPLMIYGSIGITAVIILLAYLNADRTYKHIGVLTKSVIVLISLFFSLFMLIFIFARSNPIFYLLSSLFNATIFSIYIFIDLARLEKRDFTSPALMALWLFFDIVLLLKQFLASAFVRKK